VAELTALSIRDLTVRYYGRDLDALSGIALDVEAGTFTSIAGRNGAGKSTLALVAAGLLPRVVRAVASGRVVIDGEVVLDRRPDAVEPATIGQTSSRAGIVFPNPANQLSGTKTSVREELAFGLENLGVPRAEMGPRIDRVLADLGIGHLADRAPYALSGGEQQRVAIASIVAMALPVMVLDEPTAQLDPVATEMVADLLMKLASEGIAVLAAEHSPEVLGRSDRTLVLAGGREVALGPPGEALAPDALGAADLASPTIVAISAAAGVPPALAFDEAAIASALEIAAREGRLGDAVPNTDPAGASAVQWRPVRATQPVDVHVRGLVHRYPNGVEAVRGVDLQIGRGSTVAIVGQNGSGKTTLVKHLNGLLRPTAGSIEVGSVDTASLPVHLLAQTVGFVFQDPDDQLFNRSVGRELRFGPRNLRLPEAEATALVEQAIEVIGLATDRDTNPYDLNVSARKLVALGSVLATDPAVLVLDEPTTGQDAPGVAGVGAIVEAMRAAGRTVIAITHDMEFAANHFERIVVMRHGEVVADGTASQIFAPSNAELLASTGLKPPPAARIGARLGLDRPTLDWPALRSAVLARTRGDEGRPASSA
jgi:energy-coupling factor transport system ATP-binding protein